MSGWLTRPLFSHLIDLRNLKGRSSSCERVERLEAYGVGYMSAGYWFCTLSSLFSASFFDYWNQLCNMLLLLVMGGNGPVFMFYALKFSLLIILLLQQFNSDNHLISWFVAFSRFCLFWPGLPTLVFCLLCLFILKLIQNVAVVWTPYAMYLLLLYRPQ